MPRSVLHGMTSASMPRSVLHGMTSAAIRQSPPPLCTRQSDRCFAVMRDAMLHDTRHATHHIT
eukprot:361821-Chlamydomonas_euryale.AAC.7